MMAHRVYNRDSRLMHTIYAMHGYNCIHKVHIETYCIQSNIILYNNTCYIQGG